jgi:hypothetical protein|tara:strand:+ start:4408 stop:4668 length:261 start_codon:yes stop_codon:yes gene_type:complete
MMNGEWKDDFEESMGSPKKKLSMFIVRMKLECTCNRLFFTALTTTELEGEFEKRCPLCLRTHRISWCLQTRTDEDLDDELKEGGVI